MRNEEVKCLGLNIIFDKIKHLIQYIQFDDFSMNFCALCGKCVDILQAI